MSNEALRKDLTPAEFEAIHRLKAGRDPKDIGIEVWLPSEGRYREATSCSNYLDYSARRLQTRVKGDGGNALVHTLNGTACAVSRTLVFLFEHHQQPDGTLAVPAALQPYTGFASVGPR